MCGGDGFVPLDTDNQWTETDSNGNCLGVWLESFAPHPFFLSQSR